jgi:hypothetical protein
MTRRIARDALPLPDEDWRPPPGMEKVCCLRCNHDFARPTGSDAPRCPDCTIFHRKRWKREEVVS